MRGWETTAALAVVTVVLGVAGWSGCGDDESDEPPASGPLTLGISGNSPEARTATDVAIEEGYFADAGIDDFEVVTGNDYVDALQKGKIDIALGDTTAFLAAAHRSPPLDPGEILLLGGHRSRPGEAAELPVESIATTADFLDGHVDLVYGYLEAQLAASELLADEGAEISDDLGFSADGMAELVREEQAQGRLPAGFEWRVHVNVEPLHNVQEEAGLGHDPPENELDN